MHEKPTIPPLEGERDDPLRHADDLVCRFTLPGLRLVGMNQALEALLGRSSRECLGLGLAELLQGCRPMEDALAGVAASQFPVLITLPLSLADTVARRRLSPRAEWVEWRISRVEPRHDDDSGGPLELLAVGRDVTGRVEREEELKAALLRAETARDKAESKVAEALDKGAVLDALMEYIPEGVAIASAPAGEIRMVSRHGRNMARPGAEAVGSRQGVVRQLAPLPGAHGLKPLEFTEEMVLARAMRRGEVITNEERVLVRDDGSMVPVLVNAGPIRDKEGTITGSVVAWREISELKAKELLLHQREQEFRAIVENAPDLIVRIDRSLGLVYANPAAQRLLGLDGPSQADLPLYEIMAGESFLKLEEAISKVVETGWSLDLDIETHGAALNLRLVPERDLDGQVELVLGIGRDVSHERRLQGELIQAKEAAEAGSRAKSEFLAAMSHEIRTPMNGIVGMTELALMSAPDGVVREYMQLVRQSGMVLLELIGDILDLARIEAGRAELEVEEFPLRPVLDMCLKPLELTAARKGLGFSLTVSEATPPRIVGDPGKLRQILTNLVGNAIKFTETGGIAVRVGPGQGREIVFEIEDTGIGIASERLDSIFESFSQAGNMAHARYGGTGLGLAISRHLAELMGGVILVRSQEGVGSTFIFRAAFESAAESSRGLGGLPLTPDAPGPLSPPGPPTPEDAQPASARLKVLLVEDNTVNRILGSELLGLLGHEASTAENGRQALEQLPAGGFDLVLMDVRMPVMDGREALRRIRAGEAGPPDIPVVAVTAHALKGDREKLMEEGMDAYLSKPYDLDSLRQAIQTALAAQHARNVKHEGRSP